MSPIRDDDEEEEARCRRCGRCCHEKVRVDGRVVITDVPCPFLDTATNRCRVYAERFARQPHCATARRSAEAGGMPGDCPYVAGLPGYSAPVMIADHPEYLPLVDHYFPGRSPRAAAWRKARDAERGAAPEAGGKAPAGAGLAPRVPGKRP